MPARILDLFTEFRDRTNGLPTPAGASLLGALAYFGLDAMGATEKKEMRALIMRGRALDAEEQIAILDYCQGDVDALARLLPAMLPQIDLPRALLAWPLHGRRCRHGAQRHADRRRDAGAPAGRLDGHPGRPHSRDRCSTASTTGAPSSPTLGGALAALGIPWPRLESGQLDLSDDTFRQMAKAHPLVSPYRELRSCAVRPAAQRSGGRQRWA